MGIFDLPAKAAVLCCKQYNGKYGCTVCYHPGKRLSNNARVYLPDTVYPDRTHAEVINDATIAEETNSPVRGIKYKSPFSSIFDLVASIPVDYMHAVLEGAVRRLMKSWFSSQFHGTYFYLGRYVSTTYHPKAT